jgi:predicted nucleic acid-binding protein
VTTFVDTSALYAFLSGDDPHHEEAVSWVRDRAPSEREVLVSHNYVVVESAAIVLRRLGRDALRALFEDLLPIVAVTFVDESLHRAAITAHLADPGGPSLVDRVSFQVMRDGGLRRAFAFDADFDRQGFETVP